MVSVEVRSRVVCIAALLLLIGQMIAFGANANFLSAFFAYAEVVVCLGVNLLCLREATARFWGEAVPVLLLFGAALAWAATPMVIAAAQGQANPALAPDEVPLELLKLVGLSAMGLIGAQIGLSRARLRQFIVYLVIGGLIYCILSLWIGQISPLTVFGQPKGAHTYRFTGTLLNANAAGCLFAMFSLISFGLFQSLMKRTNMRESRMNEFVRLALVGGAVLVALGGCVLTQSRTALTLTVVLGLVLVAIEGRRRYENGQLDRRTGLFAIGGAVGILLFGLGLGATQVDSRCSTFLIDAQLRGDMFLHYIAALGRSPWFGYGLGGFRPLHEAILTPDLAAAAWDFGAAHSALTQSAFEGGVPFALLLCAAGGLMVWKIVRARRAGSPLGAVITGVCAAILLAFAFSFVDIALNVPAVAAFSALLLGLAWGQAIAATHSRQPARGAA